MLLKRSFMETVKGFLRVDYCKQRTFNVVFFLSISLVPTGIQALDSPPHLQSEKTISTMDTLIKGQEQWHRGELEKALLSLEEAVKLDPSNKKTSKVLKSMQFQKKKIDGLLKTASSFIEKNNYEDARKSLEKASFINSQYEGFQKVFQKLEVKDLTDNEKQNMLSLLENVQKFKELAAINYAKALLLFSKDKGMKQLFRFNEKIWTKELSQTGWKVFFNSAILVYNDDFYKNPLVSYYNPFSDVYLITVWEKGVDGYKIIDAEILLGDFVRGTKNAVDNTPFWLRDKKNPVVNLGIGVAISVLAFEEIFNTSTVQVWRSKLKVLNNFNLLNEYNYPNISITFGKHLLNVFNFSNPKEDNRQLKECHNLIGKLVRSAEVGAMDTILRQADETPSETKNVLENLSPMWVKNLTVASSLNDSGDCFVFLNHVSYTNGSIIFSLKYIENTLQVKRIDIVDYQQFYNSIKIYQEKQVKGVL